MSPEAQEHPMLDDPFAALDAVLDGLAADAANLEQVRATLLGVAKSAGEAEHDELHSCATVLAELVSVVSCLQGEPAEELIEFLEAGLGTLKGALGEQGDAVAHMDDLQKEAHDRWGEYLSVLDDTAGAARCPPETPQEQPPESEDDPSQVNLILSSLASKSASFESEHDAPPDEGQSESGGAARQVKTATGPQSAGGVPGGIPAPPPQSPPDVDEELLDAYLEDAAGCLASIENAVLAFEAEPENREPLNQICRELHTLKGASGSVGLRQLANYLHEVEDRLQQAGFQDESAGSATGSDLVDQLLQTVDTVAKQIAAIQNRSLQPAAEPAGSQDRVAPSTGTHPQGPPVESLGSESCLDLRSEDSVRVKAAQLDRLMDLLAELVLLRNRRDTRVAELKRLNEELTRCASRIRVFADGFTGSFSRGPVELKSSSGSFPANARSDAKRQNDAAVLANQRCHQPLSEIASDISEVARSLRELYEPVSKENKAVSRFIRQFRQELAELRRQPLSGLFRRLQRAARDAARAEGKEVSLQLIGEHAGLERSLQERLYEPLLHLVRNAVSHGIETEKQRTAAGKDSVGTVTLEARGGPSLLVLEIRDDGRGLDYEALRRRGLERGLIPAEGSVGRDELARLIFRPGFSTRESAGTISGRGVGMDVVASVLDRLHSRVDVDSVEGQGTTIRLTIPLRSVIEHAMLFRSAGRVFALPMQCIRSADDGGKWKGDAFADPTMSAYAPESGRAGASPWAASKDSDNQQGLPTVRFCRLLDEHADPSAPAEQMLVVAERDASAAAQPSDSSNGSDAVGVGRVERQMGLLVDEIIGPEEVVVRPLPPVFKRHRLFAGLTLSGSGEIVLVFSGDRLLETALSHGGQPDAEKTRDRQSPRRPDVAPRVLVVDDSLSARRSLAQMLQRRGFEVAEAGDGFEALDRIRGGDFQLVLTDLEMPRLGGFELLSELKSGRRTSEIRVVVVSSRGEDEFRTRAEQLGAEAYLVKPVSDNTLTKTLDRIAIRS